MLKIRNVILVLGALMSPLASAETQVSIGIRFPHVSIGINLPAYPRLVAVPGYPVYYAPHVQANFFFYDGMYWVYQSDNWYASAWYNGPWGYVPPDAVPIYILRVPVRYYRHPPVYFHGWQQDAPPRWGDHWGGDWEHRRGDWNKHDHRAAPPPAQPHRRLLSGLRRPPGVATGVLRGLGDTRTPMLLNLAGHWGLGLPVGYALCFVSGWGVRGLWVGLSVGLISVGLVLVLVWARRVRTCRATFAPFAAA